jgi:Protein of unknown function (DUF3105).
MAKNRDAKHDVKKQRKQEAREQKVTEQKRAQKRALASRVGLYAAVSLVVLASGYWAYSKLTEKITWVDVPILPSPHIALGEIHPPYNSDPPTSGPHTAALARWGVHSEPIAKETQLHNLEDGGVVINYDCQDCPELIERLKVIADRYDRVGPGPIPRVRPKDRADGLGQDRQVRRLRRGADRPFHQETHRHRPSWRPPVSPTASPPEPRTPTSCS